MRRLLLAPVLAAGLLLPLAVPSSAAAPGARATDDGCPVGRVGDDGFTDVPTDNPHEAAVDCIVWWGVAAGRTARTYVPAAEVSRGQMATFIANTVRTSGGELPPASRDWFDDDDGSPHEDSTNRLREAGIVTGRGDGTYGPTAPVRRDAMATFLVRATEHRTGDELPAGQDAFPDDEGNTHEASIDKAAAAGFTGGTSSGYRPDLLVRRDQMGSFLARVLDLLVEDGHASFPSETRQPPPPPDGRLAPLPPDPGGTGGYTFLITQDDGSGRPVAWDPCKPLKWAVRRNGEIPGGDELLTRVVQEVSAATGIVFERQPDTGERPTRGFRPPDAPVLVAWSTQAESPDILGGAAGNGGAQYTQTSPGTRRYVTGQVVLDRDRLATWAAAPTENLVLHEFGHMVGLGHVDDPVQVMHSNTDGETEFQLGDRRGLRRVGDGQCF